MIEEDSDRQYTVIFTEVFEMERDSAYLYMNGLVGPGPAGEWEAYLNREIEALPDFPGPRANAIDEQATALFGMEVRRLLYYGPKKKRPSRNPFRILYTIIEPPDSTEGFVRILRLIHGSRPLLMPDE